MPFEVIAQRAADRTAPLAWYERDTPVYRVGAVAQAWGVDPVTYLRWPPKLRRYCELFVVAKALKEQAAHDAIRAEHAKDADKARFEQQAQAWERESRVRWLAERR